MIESAEAWNRVHPPGSPVRVLLVDGSAFVAETVGPARQWGELALVELRGRGGTWTLRALEPMAATPASIPGRSKADTAGGIGAATGVSSGVSSGIDSPEPA
jgi:hypothetical protein